MSTVSGWREVNDGRTSHEVRGLKSKEKDKAIGRVWSHLTRGAWIEIEQHR